MLSYFKRYGLLLIFVCILFTGFTNVVNVNSASLSESINAAVDAGDSSSNYIEGVNRVTSKAFNKRIVADQSEGKLYSGIGQLIKTALGFLGSLILIIIIYAGFLWLTAGGNTEQVEKAQKWMLNAVIGLVIITMAFFITDYLLEIVTDIGPDGTWS